MSARSPSSSEWLSSAKICSLCGSPSSLNGIISSVAQSSGSPPPPPDNCGIAAVRGLLFASPLKTRRQHTHALSGRLSPTEIRRPVPPCHHGTDRGEGRVPLAAQRRPGELVRGSGVETDTLPVCVAVCVLTLKQQEDGLFIQSTFKK